MIPDIVDILIATGWILGVILIGVAAVLTLLVILGVAYVLISDADSGHIAETEVTEGEP